MSAAKMSCVIGRRVSTPCTLRWISAISFIAMMTGKTRPFSLSRRYIWHSALWSLCTMRKSSTSFIMAPSIAARSGTLRAPEEAIERAVTARTAPWTRALRVLPLLLANALALLALPLPGTGDVGQFLRWTIKMREWGLVEGYHVGNNPYPPLSPLWLAAAGGWAQLTAMEPHAALKLLLLAMLLASTAIVLAWTRSALFAGLFQLALLLNSAALGYLDVLFLPPLLLTFWA